MLFAISHTKGTCRHYIKGQSASAMDKKTAAEARSGYYSSEKLHLRRPDVNLLEHSRGYMREIFVHLTREQMDTRMKMGASV